MKVSGPKYSPMLDQYFGMKSKHPEAILLSRVGDFYEAYGEDAEIVARALQIALTSKEAGAGKRVAMAGVPHHALTQYLARLVGQRFVVALAEQLELPQPNRLVRRDVVRLVTPGTLIEEQFLDGKQNNYLAAIAAAGETFALAYADVSTGYSAATAIEGENAYDEVFAELTRIGPAEIVADVPADLRAALAASLEGAGVRLTTPAVGIVGARERATLPGFSIGESLAVHRALEALAAFVSRTGVTNGERGLSEPQLYRRRQFLAIDAATRKHLELTQAQGQNPRATLLATLDLCATSMGSRMLARWILAPLVDAQRIGTRQDAIAALLEEHARRGAIREALKGAFDLERIAQKIRFRRATPRDLASLRRTLETLRPLRQLAFPPVAALFERIGDFGEMLDDLRRTLVEEPPAQIGEGGAIRPESNAELAECASLRVDARSKLSELEQARTRAHGHKDAQSEVREPLRLRDRSEQELCARGPARLRAQTDAGERRALCDAGTQGTRARDFDRTGAPRAPRAAAVRRASRTPRCRDRASARGGRRRRRDRRPRGARAVRRRTRLRAPRLRRRQRRRHRRRTPSRSWRRFSARTSFRTTCG